MNEQLPVKVFLKKKRRKTLKVSNSVKNERWLSFLTVIGKYIAREEICSIRRSSVLSVLGKLANASFLF